MSECTDVEQLKESSTGCKDELTECKTLRMVGLGDFGDKRHSSENYISCSVLTIYKVNIVKCVRHDCAMNKSLVAHANKSSLYISSR